MDKRYLAKRGERIRPNLKGDRIRPGRGPPPRVKTPRLVLGALGLRPASRRLVDLGKRLYDQPHFKVDEQDLIDQAIDRRAE
jgi:hypothetical protein